MSNFEIIENTDEAMSEFGFNYGREIYDIYPIDVQALLEGKMLAANVKDEYSVFVRLRE